MIYYENFTLSYIIFSSLINSTGTLGEIYLKDYIDWIITFVITIPPTIALYFTAIAFREESKSRYLETFSNIYSELTKHLSSSDRNAVMNPIKEGKREANVKSRWIINFLNSLEILTFLYKNKKIPEDMIGFFENMFRYGRYLMEQEYPEIMQIPGAYKDIIPICVDNNWEALNADVELPKNSMPLNAEVENSILISKNTKLKIIAILLSMVFFALILILIFNN